MSIRLHLSSSDVASIRLASSVSALLETANAVRRIALSNSPIPTGVDPAKLAMVTDLVGYRGRRPSFALHGGPSIDAGVEQLLSISGRVIAEDLEWVARSGRRLPPWTGTLVEECWSARAALANAYRHLYQALVQPYEPVFTSRILHHRQLLTERVMTGGVDALMSGLHPAVHWSTPVLSVSTTSLADFDVDLDGTGLLLEPAFFDDGAGVCHDKSSFGTVVTFGLGARRVVVNEPPRPLVSVLGRTRARVLVDLQRHSGAGTSQMADGVGVSAATASEHLRALHDAGLVRTERRGRAVAHHITQLGWSLISASSSTADSSNP